MEEYKRITYLVLDESGDLSLDKNVPSYNRYFVIAGFLTQNLPKVRSIHKKTERNIKNFKHIPFKSKVELKGSKLNANHHALFLNSLFLESDIIPVAIIVDKENLPGYALKDTVSFNTYILALIKYLLRCNIPILQHTDELSIKLDNRDVATKMIYNLKDYLNYKLKFSNIYCETKYLNSFSNREIQSADLIANFMFKKYNKPIKTKKLMKEAKFLKNTYISLYPFKKFGK